MVVRVVWMMIVVVVADDDGSGDDGADDDVVAMKMVVATDEDCLWSVAFLPERSSVDVATMESIYSVNLTKVSLPILTLVFTCDILIVILFISWISEVTSFTSFDCPFPPFSSNEPGLRARCLRLRNHIKPLVSPNPD